jgi:hypothetical protein
VGVLTLLAVSLGAQVPVFVASAATTAPIANCDLKDGKPVPCDGAPDCAVKSDAGNCGLGGKCGNVNQCDLITDYINPAINLISALVGVAVVISLTIGGIQYGSSGGDAQKVTMAKNRIRNSIVALLTFLFLYAMINFLIPGGLL